MKFAIFLCLLVAINAAPTEKIESHQREEQYQKVIKSAPVATSGSEYREEHHERADLSDLGKPVLESTYPRPADIDHVDEKAYRVNVEELEQKFNSAQGQGGEGLEAFLAMVQTERTNLQRVYDEMSTQAESNVRGSLQKSREWEEKAKDQARLALQRLQELQRKAEARTQELLTRQSVAIECVECEEKRISAAQSVGTGEVVSGSHVSEAENVETTTLVEEWSTVYEDHSSTVIA